MQWMKCGDLMNKTERIKVFLNEKIDFVHLFLIGAFCAVGLYNEYLCCFAAAVLLGYLIYTVIRKKRIFYYINLPVIAVTAVTSFYFLSVLWAVDKGEAFLGAFRFLSPLLLMLVVMQKENNAEKYFDILPSFSVFMVIVSAILSFIPSTESLVEIAGRLCGFFQYSNTFALFLLISLIICITKQKLKAYDFLCIAVLLFGIIYSGSRTVFVLSAVSILAVIIFSKNKKVAAVVFSVMLVAVIVAVVTAYATDNFYSIGRFLTISFKDSTFVGRLLYYIDALPQILRHPFGMGYAGYYFTQQSFQTGVYSVFSVHNDFLQLMLDIGWIPSALLIAAVLKTFFSKKTDFKKRLLLFVMCAHSFFDFDMQFIAMYMLLILLLDFDDGEKKLLKINKVFMTSAFAVCSAVCLYIGCMQTFSFFGKYEISSAMYPYKTRDSIMLLVSETDMNKTEKIAEKIISRNEYVAVAYSAKAKIAFSKGDIHSMIENKEKALNVSVFEYDEYVDYCNMLIYAISLYEEAGNENSVAFCVKKLVEIEEKLNANEERLSYFGKMINEQPTTQLPEDVHAFIREAAQLYITG